MRRTLWLGFALALAGHAGGAEVTLKNDSLANFGDGAIVWGFVADEMAASWLTSPCDGNLVAVQVFWRSPGGTEAATVGNAIDIYRSGTFPTPGALAQTISGPVLNDNALNEWRYLDENNTLPLSVPVTNGETVVVAFQFAQAPTPNSDPSVVRDTDGNTPGRNAIYADIGGGTFVWIDSGSAGVNGDWIIRAVVNCQAVPTDADVSVTMTANPPAYTAGAALQYTIVVANAGPAASANTTLVDTFPAAFQSPTWICAPSGGATCPAGSSGNIVGSAGLPSGSHLTFTVDGTVAAGAAATLTNSMTAVVNAPATDTNTANNTASLDVSAAANDRIFMDGFDAGATMPRPTPAHATGRPVR